MEEEEEEMRGCLGRGLCSVVLIKERCSDQNRCQLINVFVSHSLINYDF